MAAALQFFEHEGLFPIELLLVKCILRHKSKSSLRPAYDSTGQSGHDPGLGRSLALLQRGKLLSLARLGLHLRIVENLSTFRAGLLLRFGRRKLRKEEVSTGTALTGLLTGLRTNHFGLAKSSPACRGEFPFDACPFGFTKAKIAFSAKHSKLTTAAFILLREATLGRHGIPDALGYTKPRGGKPQCADCSNCHGLTPLDVEGLNREAPTQEGYTVDLTE